MHAETGGRRKKNDEKEERREENAMLKGDKMMWEGMKTRKQCDRREKEDQDTMQQNKVCEIFERDF
jgi:transcription elongation GreA/GreB family factor